MIEFNLKKFSEKRTQIMGIAMLFVVFFHSSLEFSSVPPIHFIKHIGDIGVDCFLMVSGMGIYFSLSKDGNTLRYLNRRINRILPAYFIVNGLWFFLMNLLLGHSISNFFMDISSLNFWINGNLTTWYLSSLLFLQILTPLYIYIYGIDTEQLTMLLLD